MSYRVAHRCSWVSTCDSGRTSLKHTQETQTHFRLLQLTEHADKLPFCEQFLLSLALLYSKPNLMFLSSGKHDANWWRKTHESERSYDQVTCGFCLRKLCRAQTEYWADTWSQCPLSNFPLVFTVGKIAVFSLNVHMHELDPLSRHSIGAVEEWPRKTIKQWLRRLIYFIQQHET